MATLRREATPRIHDVAAGDSVAARWRYRWKHDQCVFGEAPSGRWIAMDGVHSGRLAAGGTLERGRSRTRGAS
jgi:hypothetical protein